MFGSPTLRDNSFKVFLQGAGPSRHCKVFMCLSLDWGTDLSPPMVKAFCSLVVGSKISIADNLRRGLTMESISDIYYLWWREESINHLFIHYNVTSSIWDHFLIKTSVEWCFLSSLLGFFRLGGGLLWLGRECFYWDSFPFSFFCFIWKERNESIFSREQSSLEDIILSLALRIAKWTWVRNKFLDLKVDNILHNWGDYLNTGCLKEENEK